MSLSIQFMEVIEMTSNQLTQNLNIIENVNQQVKYFTGVVLKHFTSAVHKTSSSEDALVEEFSEQYHQVLISELENYKQMFMYLATDLDSIQENFEKSIPIVDKVDDSIHQYELYLVTTANILNKLLNQMDIEIQKLSTKL